MESQYQTLDQKVQNTPQRWYNTGEYKKFYRESRKLNRSYQADDLSKQLQSFEDQLEQTYHRLRWQQRKACAKAVITTFLVGSALLYWFEPAEQLLLDNLPAFEQILDRSVDYLEKK